MWRLWRVWNINFVFELLDYLDYNSFLIRIKYVIKIQYKKKEKGFQQPSFSLLTAIGVFGQVIGKIIQGKVYACTVLQLFVLPDLHFQKRNYIFVIEKMG